MKFTHLAKFLVFAGLFTLPALGYADWNALNMTAVSYTHLTLPTNREV